ncbi:MAG: hypothetical protein A2172_04885 [Candidatus Woykebacteria bacterium RBG_13_40_15]|uniref:Uncharacterized protein n=1 Tax=Candidatus Woykebacteria bacterium RBG_13_40_15 TaxID=1802593 RepID=A0A1G1W758_9BACT|nr:MAG: hypothetical protein A2172_04885 [Candidatus Woykebacteria bacterium RBG_13_40_15]
MTAKLNVLDIVIPTVGILSLALFVTGLFVLTAAGIKIDSYRGPGQAIPVSSWRLFWIGMGLISPGLVEVILGIPIAGVLYAIREGKRG